MSKTRYTILADYLAAFTVLILPGARVHAQDRLPLAPGYEAYRHHEVNKYVKQGAL